jgi:murein DD-endopeptidase MepM/ murein hydrolase activator NlpD
MKLIGKFFRSPRLFTGVSWGVTAVLVVSLLGFTFLHIHPPAASAAPEPLPTTGAQEPASLPVTAGAINGTQAIVRFVSLDTSVTSNTSYSLAEYTVKHGDALFSIAKKYNIKPETVLWANVDILHDNPDSLRAGQVLKIPPVDGIYYQWADGDTLDGIATKYKVTPEDIINWPGNNIDLTDPKIETGTYVMIPGGKRQSVQWIVPVASSGSSGTARVSGSSCGDGPVDNNFQWPTVNHYLSGNDFWSGHLGIDIAAGLGAPVWASAAGVVTMAQGGDNYGYGNVVMIYHGNGYSTLYGHLDQINVVPCQIVSSMEVIGYAGSTGNSTGPHLHFEIRSNGQFINPWSVLP